MKAETEYLEHEQERAKFEAWFQTKVHGRLDRMPDKSYKDPHAWMMWIGWIARSEQSEKK